MLLSDTNRRYNENVRERRSRTAATIISHASLVLGLTGSLGTDLQQCKKNHTKPIALKFGEHLQDIHLYSVLVFTPYTIYIAYPTHKHIIKVLLSVWIVNVIITIITKHTYKLGAYHACSWCDFSWSWYLSQIVCLCMYVYMCVCVCVYDCVLCA